MSGNVEQVIAAGMTRWNAAKPSTPIIHVPGATICGAPLAIPRVRVDVPNEQPRRRYAADDVVHDGRGEVILDDRGEVVRIGRPAQVRQERMELPVGLPVVPQLVEDTPARHNAAAEELKNMSGLNKSQKFWELIGRISWNDNRATAQNVMRRFTKLEELIFAEEYHRCFIQLEKRFAAANLFANTNKLSDGDRKTVVGYFISHGQDTFNNLCDTTTELFGAEFTIAENMCTNFHGAILPNLLHHELRAGM